MFWYPWGKEAIERARSENKPILLSVGYSTCYWCHVMEREVFENLSIASLMNKHFINIKVDREEHPELDDMYMIVRQMLTKQGGWPNNVFLTPDLKPFFAGGTWPARQTGDRSSFTQILEWMHYIWTDQEGDVRAKAEEFTRLMEPFAVQAPPKKNAVLDATKQAESLFKLLDGYHDESSGGFYQAPKFPQECYLDFLLTYHELTGNVRALDMSAHSLGMMAAGGIYDHVASGFHRYAVDKEWYVPHFEKMLYNQAQLASLYTKVATHTGSAYFRDIAMGILDFTAGPLTDGEGGFYTAIDAETEGVEGAYYAWSPHELKELLTDEEASFFMTFYALADIPEFPGHKHTDGKVIIARKPLPAAARESGMPYAQLAAMSGKLMNRLLVVRNQRAAPHLDNKIIVAWNGLMIAAYAEASLAFGKPRYLEIAKKAAEHILQYAFDDDGMLQRVLASTPPVPAKLEDHAYLMHGLLALERAEPDDDRMGIIEALADRVEELFADKEDGAYFVAARGDYQLFRSKSADDASMPSGMAVLLQIFVQLYLLTEIWAFRER
ncbi:MAG: thioredoxin domain-containing protein, partial [Alphaproteobacteria bacterium]